MGVAERLLAGPTSRIQERAVVEQVEHVRAHLWRELEADAGSLRERGLRVVTTVCTGDVTEEILACAREVDADLIALTTHATRNLSRWMLRSTAQHLLTATTLPTLIISDAGEMAHADHQIDGVIVPLDGWAIAEAALPLASELALRPGVSLSIIRVVSNQATLLVQPDSPDDTAGVHRLNVALEQTVTEANRYIQSTVNRLRGTVRDVTGNVRIGDPAAVLSAFCAERPRSLVVIATHGIGGDHWWTYGSVAEKLVTTIPNPILIVRPLTGKRGRMRPDPAIAARYPD
jgi:nucleotide-binding universal stress UspA family protein